MDMLSLAQDLNGNSYPGRGIVIGTSADGKKAVTAYFIMGRSENSRNRVFVTEGEGIRTEAFDPAKCADPSLIIYAPVRVLGTDTIVTNGDQTDTVYDLMSEGQTFQQALRTREFEPDAPNYTPRISGVLHVEAGRYNFAMSILKSDDGDPSACLRQTFAYENAKNTLALAKKLEEMGELKVDGVAVSILNRAVFLIIFPDAFSTVEGGFLDKVACGIVFKMSGTYLGAPGDFDGLNVAVGILCRVEGFLRVERRVLGNK